MKLNDVVGARNKIEMYDLGESVISAWVMYAGLRGAPALVRRVSQSEKIEWKDAITIVALASAFVHHLSGNAQKGWELASRQSARMRKGIEERPTPPRTSGPMMIRNYG